MAGSGRNRSDDAMGHSDLSNTLRDVVPLKWSNSQSEEVQIHSIQQSCTALVSSIIYHVYRSNGCCFRMIRGDCTSYPRVPISTRNGRSAHLGFVRGPAECELVVAHTIHVWYIYLHLVDFYGKCRKIYHTWILWVVWFLKFWNSFDFWIRNINW